MNGTISNALVVTADAVRPASLRIADGKIASIDDGRSAPTGSIDCDGDFLLPGLIDLHTDNVEQHFFPRPNVRWPSSLSAAPAHDWQMIGAGVTTVLNSLSLGDYESDGARRAMLDAAIAALTKASDTGLALADHLFHFRCELPDPAVMENRRAPPRPSKAQAAQLHGSHAGPAPMA